MPVIDLADGAVRRYRQLSHFPRYSARVRATGMDGEFGGAKFRIGGETIANLLVKHADLKPDDDVLEIGVGPGRVPFALVDRLTTGSFTGMDIDPVSIAACQQSDYLTSAGFRFTLADLDSDMYNLGGSDSAERYTFPYDDNAFDVIFLMSVFTHMTQPECARYASEIVRMLRPGGRVLVSCFLKDFGLGNAVFSFQHPVGDIRRQPQEGRCGDPANIRRLVRNPTQGCTSGSLARRREARTRGLAGLHDLRKASLGFARLVTGKHLADRPHRDDLRRYVVDGLL